MCGSGGLMSLLLIIGLIVFIVWAVNRYKKHRFDNDPKIKEQKKKMSDDWYDRFG